MWEGKSSGAFCKLDCLHFSLTTKRGLLLLLVMAFHICDMLALAVSMVHSHGVQ